MAAGTKLQMTFETMSGRKTVTLQYAKSDATTADVKALGASFIDNGEIFMYPPVALNAAKMITTSETVYDLSGN